MRTPLLLATAVLLAAGSVPAAVQGGGPPTFHLTHRAKLDRLRLECLWDSVRILQPTAPAQHSPGRVVVPFKEVAPEILTLEQAQLDLLLAELDAVPGQPVVTLPEDNRLLLHRDAATETLECLPAFKHPWSTAKEPSDVAFTRLVEDWPESADGPGWDGPPRSKSFLLTRWQPGSRTNGRIPVGIGFARIEHTGASVFAPSRDLALGLSQEGDSGPVWWLNVAEDAQGNYWLWYEKG